ncbi:MAG: trypsin-like serine protease [Kordiimonadaceae bacterium]|nr:trypsin-like serine protease [Kordiimonadaceae bacterium]MBO6569685.1 trypsin-like serine protease [Kordiimonadaceae bacterium]MBO6966220.1 trypsin-like serine protease [Kordiimonadaceae bacterium]
MTSQPDWLKLMNMKRVALSIIAACLLAAPGVYAQESEQREGIRKDLPAHLRPQNNVTSFHRRSVDSTEKPWQSIGRVNIGGRAHCSGTLVAANIVLTAAHCLFSKASGQMVVPGIVHFVAGYSRGEHLGHSKVKSYRVGDGYRGEEGATRANMGHDWALLVLEEPLGEELGFLTVPNGWFEPPKPTAPPRPNKRKVQIAADVTTAGYPGDRKHILSLEENCNIITTANQGRILLTSCIALKGDSGGPILQQVDGTWHIIGVQTSALKAGDKISGVGLSAIVYQPYLDILSQ